MTTPTTVANATADASSHLQRQLDACAVLLATLQADNADDYRASVRADALALVIACDGLVATAGALWHSLCAVDESAVREDRVLARE